MTLLKTILATAAIAGFATSAAAQDTGAYVNLGVDAFNFDAYTLGGKIGYDFTENFAVEGQAAIGIADDEIDGVDVGIDNTFGAFLKGTLPLDNGFDIFARAGYQFTEIGASVGEANDSVDTDGFAIGAGGQYMFDGLNGVRLEYTYFDIDGDVDGVEVSGGSDVFSLSYVRKF